MSNISLEQAIDRIREEFDNEGEDFGSYYYSWQANIAMSFIDASKEHSYQHGVNFIANKAAKNFLHLLRMDNK